MTGKQLNEVRRNIAIMQPGQFRDMLALLVAEIDNCNDRLAVALNGCRCYRDGLTECKTKTA